MSLHYPFEYGGYERAFLSTFINLLDEFCTGCHTNENDGLQGKCGNCPVGFLVLTSKDYILESIPSKVLVEKTKIMSKIKNEIKPIEPHPMFNPNWIFTIKRGEDRLLPLRELLKDLDFQDDRIADTFVKSKNAKLRKIQERLWKEECREYKKREKLCSTAKSVKNQFGKAKAKA
jgi:hypothetical protein